MAQERHRRTTAKQAPKQAEDNVVRLRRDIDSGRTGDKVRAVDPAAAPLGTDDEAAGHPPSAQAVRAARAQERRGLPATRAHPRLSTVLVALAALAVALAAAAGLLLLP